MDRKLLIVATADGKDILGLDDYTLDLAYGSGENDFECSFDGEALNGKERIYIDGTGYGGIVDSIEYDTQQRVPKYKGRTWQGVLNSRIVQPPKNQAYLTVKGEVNEVLRSLVSLLGLNNLFEVRTTSTGKFITHQFNRYVKAYDSIKAMVEQYDLKLCFKCKGSKVELWAEPAQSITSVDSDLMDFKIEQFKNKPNHLICLGQGELVDRTVIHLYADVNGKISKVQSIFGIDEIVEVYDYSNAEDTAELEKGGRERFEELLGAGKVEADLKKQGDWEVGDIVTATELQTGLKVVAKITKKIIKASRGVSEITYEIGQKGDNNGENRGI